jgi:hypothetical protein
LLPAAIDETDGVFDIERSACPAAATTSVAVAVLLAALGSVVAELTVAVLLIAVPAAVPAFTVTPNVIVAVPGAKLGFVQVSVASVQVHPAGPLSDTAVVFAGSVSVSFTVVAVLGPALVTTCV